MSAEEIAPGVTINSEVMGGRPCIAGTRMQTRVAAAYKSAAAFIKDYDGHYTAEQHAAAVAFEASYLGDRLRRLDRLEEAWFDLNEAFDAAREEVAGA